MMRFRTDRFMRVISCIGFFACFSACKPPDPAATAPLDVAARARIEGDIRSVSQQMLVAMKTRKVEAVLNFYGSQTAYAADGRIEDWNQVLAAVPARYATYTKVECIWKGPFRVDVMAAQLAVVTGILACEKGSADGRTWSEAVARTEVLSLKDGQWQITAFHESSLPGEK